MDPYLSAFILGICKALGPSVDGSITLGAIRLEVWESLVERYLHQGIVNNPASVLCEYPEIVPENQTSENVDAVVTATENQHKRESNKG